MHLTYAPKIFETSFLSFNYVNFKNKSGAGEMAKWLSVLAALQDKSHLISRLHVERFTAFYNSIFRGSNDTLF